MSVAYSEFVHIDLGFEAVAKATVCKHYLSARKLETLSHKAKFDLIRCFEFEFPRGSKIIA